MRIVYLGSGSFGIPSLRALADTHEVVLVVTPPDRPAGRRRRPAPTPAARTALELGLPVLKTPDVNEAAALRAVRDAGAEALVVIAFGQKLGPPLVAGTLAVNLHASLLPRYRGAAPINWAIIRGETETGVSAITISPRIDAGDVLGRRSTPIDPRETAGELEERLAALGPELLLDVLARHRAGTLEPRPQDERDVTRAPKLSKADGTVSFDQPAPAVRQHVHGLNPWPGCTVTLAGTRLKLCRVADLPDGPGPRPVPGTLLEDHSVACAEGRVELLEVQPPGGRPMPFAAYLHGHPTAARGRLVPA